MVCETALGLAPTINLLPGCSSPSAQAATDHSLAIKRVEAGLRSLVFWGRITTLNGKVSS